MIESEEMIISDAKDEEMSAKKGLAMCKVAMGTFIFIKRRSGVLLSWRYVGYLQSNTFFVKKAR